ncbi:MAG: hypothetical protein ACREQV_03660 [Candidatus Binatia bacterium]
MPVRISRPDDLITEESLPAKGAGTLGTRSRVAFVAVVGVVEFELRVRSTPGHLTVKTTNAVTPKQTTALAARLIQGVRLATTVSIASLPIVY